MLFVGGKAFALEGRSGVSSDQSVHREACKEGSKCEKVCREREELRPDEKVMIQTLELAMVELVAFELETASRYSLAPANSETPARDMSWHIPFESRST